MRLAMVTCFNADWHRGRVPAPYIPLNLLGLAAIARQHGHHPRVVDQTRALLDGNATDGPLFHRQVAELILSGAPDVIGLTTMCNSYPQTLRLARECRELDPTVRIVLGGPQATVVDVRSMQEFTHVDAIVRNEADRSLCAVLDRWANGDDLTGVAGVTWRRPDGSVLRNADAALLSCMDDLPFPAYDLYPVERQLVDLAPVEAGRGCPYGCTFCSTNEFFNRRYRTKSPERLVAEMSWLHDEYGFERFDLVHDMLTVDRRWVEEFSQVLIERDVALRWGCSARVDRVDDDLLAQMAAAGCMGIFFGIETGSKRLQHVVRKHLPLDRVLPVMQTCVAHEIGCTGSFITGFPEETVDDALDSFQMALDILELSPRTRAQMHLLAPLVGSPLYATHKEDLRFDGQSSDISIFLLDEEQIAVVRRFRDIFPNFYYFPSPQLDRNLAKAISAATYTCPELFIALRAAGVDLRAVLTGWTTWLRREVDAERINQGYYMYRFGLDLCRYLQTEVLPSVAAVAPSLPDLVDYFAVRYALQRGISTEPTIFRQYSHNVHALYAADGAATNPAAAASAAFNLLFVNLGVVADGTHAFLEVKVPHSPDAVIRPGDVIEVRDPIAQLRTHPHVIIRNNSRRLAFAAKHHLTERQSTALQPRRRSA